MIKKIVVLIVSLVITLCPCISFADDFVTPSDIEWIPITAQTNYETSYAVMKAYLHARNAGYKFIFGDNAPNLYKAEAQFSYNAMMTIFQNANINFPYGEIYYYFDDNIPLQFWYSASGLLTLDAFYEAWLDYYNLSPDEQKQLYSGEYFEDSDGICCFVNIDNGGSVNVSNRSSLDFLTFGTYYRFTGALLNDLLQPEIITPFTINYTDSDGNPAHIDYSFKKHLLNSVINIYFNLSSDLSSPTGETVYINGKPNSSYTYKYIYGCLCINKYNNNYYLGTYSNYTRNNVNMYNYYRGVQLSANNAFNAIVSIGQGPLKALGIAAGKAAIIETGKKGADAIPDYIMDPDPEDKEPIEKDDNPEDNPPVINKKSINIGTIINNNGDINVQLPDLNDVDPDPQPLPTKWLMSSALKTKFPFCIPFDLIAIYSVLDTEPQAPRIQQDIDFPTFTYHFDLNLEEYDEALENARKFFLVLYIFGLLFVTPKLLKA